MKTLESTSDTREILSRVGRVGPGAARRWGTLTPGEMFCHLADAYECAFGRRPAARIDNAFRRTVVKFVALRAPMRWPHGISAPAEFDPRRSGTKPDAFDSDRERVVRLVQELADLKSVVAGARHPIFGPLDLSEWKRWGYLHADHHLRQFAA